MKKENLVLFTLALLQFTNIVDFMIMMPLGDELMRIFDITPAQFSIIVASYSISAGIAGFIGVFYLDRFDRKTALMFIYSFFGLGTLACGFAPSYELLVAARFFTGLFGGLIAALALSIVGDFFPPEKRGTAMGAITAAFSVASIVGVPSGLYFATLISWRAPFFLLAGTSALVLLLAWRTIPSIRKHLDNPNSRKTPKEVIQTFIKSPNQQIAILFVFFLVLGQFSVIPFITPYLTRNVGFLPTEIPLVYLVGGGLTIFTSPLVGRFSDKYGKKRMFLIAAIFSMIPLLLITHIGAIGVPLTLMINGLFFVTISGRMIPANALMTSVVKPENRGSFMSLNSSAQQLGAGLAAFISGLIVVEPASGGLQNYNIVGYIAVIATIITIFISFKLTTYEKTN